MTAPAGIRLVSPGQLPPWHYGLLHDRPAMTLLWLTRGQGRITVNGIRRGLGTHNAVFVPPGVLFAFDLGPQALTLVLHAPASEDALFPDEPLHLRIRDARAQAELTGLLEGMQREITQNRPHLAEALSAQVQLSGVWLRRQEAAGAADHPPDCAALRLAVAYAGSVSARFRSAAGPGDLAAELGVTGTHLTRACRTACGRSALDILSERRLHEARRLLAQPAPPIGQIARDLGFNSAAYFTRFIRRLTGQSPSDLRALAQQSPGTRPGGPARLPPAPVRRILR